MTMTIAGKPTAVIASATESAFEPAGIADMIAARIEIRIVVIVSVTGIVSMNRIVTVSVTTHVIAGMGTMVPDVTVPTAEDPDQPIKTVSTRFCPSQ